MKLAIMQPYFMPYIGYFQLINSTDIFVVADNMQYTKRGWFNRNRILENGESKLFTIPLKKCNHRVNVNQRFLANNSIKERNRILKQIQCNYAKAPFFTDNYPIVRRPFLVDENNLFEFIYRSITELYSVLDIKTKIYILSSININHDLPAQDRIIEVCKHFEADIYINSIGGKALYDQVVFKNNGINLKFIKSKDIKYQQFNHDFVPWLSIIDVLMFNDIKKVKGYLNEYELK